MTELEEVIEEKEAIEPFIERLQRRVNSLKMSRENWHLVDLLCRMKEYKRLLDERYEILKLVCEDES